MDYAQTETCLSRIYPVTFYDSGKLRAIPVPLARISLCGMIEVEALKEVVSVDSPRGRYEVLSSQMLRGRGAVHSLMLLKLLASSPHRFEANDVLATQMRGEMEVGALVRLDTIASYLRGMLCQIEADQEHIDALRRLLVAYLRNGRGSGPGYQLAAYPLLWLDIDALSYQVEHGALMERMGEPNMALPFWQRAYELAVRGTYLVDEPHSDWTVDKREEVAGQLRQSVHALHRLLLAAYGEAGKEEALGLLRVYWLKHKTDEDALRPLMELLGERECFGEIEEYYQQLCAVLEEEKLAPSTQTQDMAEYWRIKQIRREHSEQVSTKDAVSLAISTGSHRAQSSFFTGISPIAQDIMEAVNVPEEDIMDQQRRQLLGKVLKGTGMAILVSHDLVLGSEITERLTKALSRPSSIDEKTLLYLEKRIGNYWQDRNDVSLPAWDLLPYVLENLQKVTALLEGSLLPTVRTHLCSIAGIAAMLIGELYYDMRKYVQARAFQELAITAAHEANNATLEAVAWGRNSFAWTYDGNSDEARNSIQKAHRLAWSLNSTVRTWLAAVEAEIQSNLGDRQACLKALGEAAYIEDRKHHQTDCYWIHFDQSLLAGYQGASFLKLSHLGHRDLIQSAQIVLQDALDSLDPSMKRRQPTLLVDLAGTYVLQENIEQACGCATKAIDIAIQINSKVLLQRFLTLRSTLVPWQETQYVQDLDRSIAPLLLPGKHHEQERG